MFFGFKYPNHSFYSYGSIKKCGDIQIKGPRSYPSSGGRTAVGEGNRPTSEPDHTGEEQSEEQEEGVSEDR